MTQGTRGLLVAIGLVLVATIAFVLSLQGRGGELALDASSGRGGAVETLGTGSRPVPLEAGDASAAQAKNARAPLRTEIEAPKALPDLEVSGQTIRLRGRLVQADKAPVVGCELQHHALDSQMDFPLGRPSPDVKKTWPKTDAEGRFQLAVEKGKRTRLVLSGKRYLFQQDSKELSSDSTSLSVPPSDTDKDLGDLVLVVAGTICGVVTDGAGKPIGGARVKLLSEGVDFAAFSLLRDDGETTDAKGAFQIGGIAAGKVRLQASGKGFVPARTELELGLGETKVGVVLQLASGFAIAGRVVDDTGKPIADARVVAQKKTVEGGMTIETTRGDASTKTDSSGTFLLSGLDDTVVTIHASSRGYQRGKVDDVAVGSSEVLIRLARCGSIEGILVDGAGQPIAASEVSVESDSTGGLVLVRNSNSTKTAADGTFRLDNVSPGQVQLHAEGTSHRPTEPQTLQVRPGELLKGVRLVARIGTTVVALVVDAAGAPVEGATVEVKKPAVNQPQQDATPGRVVRRISRRVQPSSDVISGPDASAGGELLGSAKTDKDGKARVGGLPAGQVVVSATHEVFASQKPLPLALPEAGTVEAKLAVRKCGYADIEVVDADRVPLKDCQVKLEGPLGDPDLKAARTIQADDRGKAHVKALVPGVYAAHLLAKAAPTSLGGGAMVMVGDPEPIDETRSELTVREDETTKLTLVQPLTSVFTGVLSDAKGPVRAGEVEVTRIRDNAEQNLAGFGRSISGKTDGEGNFKIEGLLPGKYSVSFGRKNAVAKHEDEIVIQSGQREFQKNLLLQGGTIQVTVVSSVDGQPVKKAKVSLHRAADAGSKRPRVQRAVMFSIAISGNGDDDSSTSMFSNEASVQTDDEGKATLKDVPPGHWQVEIEHNKHAPLTVPAFDLAPNMPLDLGTQKLTPGGSIAGEITKAGGDGVELAMVQVLRDGAKEDAAVRVPAPGGSFRKAGLAPGKYRLRANEPTQDAERWGPWVEVEVKSSETARVKLEVAK